MHKKNDKENKVTDSVDQIRDILFGEQIAIIEKRFDQLEKNLSQTISDLATKVDDNNSKLNAKIEQAQKSLQTEISDLAQQQSSELTKVESTINNKIVETESDLINQIQSSIQKLDHKASHRNELAQLLKDMADKLSD